MTPEMLEADANRFSELVAAGVGSVYAAEEIYLAMLSALHQRGLVEPSPVDLLPGGHKYIHQILTSHK